MAPSSSVTGADKTSFDIVIIGAGPAGMACASTLSRRGLSVAVIDEQPAPGGQVWRNLEAGATLASARHIWSEYSAGAAAIERFRASDCHYFPSTQLWQIEEGWRLFTRGPDGIRILTSQYLVLAVGAQERPMPFEGWQKPGVIGVGAAQILLKTSYVLPEGDVWIAGSGPLVEFFTAQMIRLGRPPKGILSIDRPGPTLSPRQALAAGQDPMGLLKGLSWVIRRKLAGVTRRRITSLKALGEDRLRQIEVTRKDGRSESFACDLLLIHDGVIPRNHEADLAATAWQMAREPSVTKFAVAGDAAGVMGAQAAAIQGALLGYRLAKESGRAQSSDAGEVDRLQKSLARAAKFRSFLDALYPETGSALEIGDQTLICRCEEVSKATITAALADAADLDELKRLTRAGMGRCQGRNCAPTLARYLPAGPDAPSHSYRTRPPLRPLTLEEIASMDDGAGQ